jgi:GntR family transcriptional regulator
MHLPREVVNSCRETSLGRWRRLGRTQEERHAMAERPALSRQIADDLRQEILRGDLPPGSLLPSERKLIERFRTTKATASKAIGILLAEGLVTTEFGRGTFVRNRPSLRRISAARRHAAHREAGKPVFDIQALAQGQVPSRRILFVGRRGIPAYSAEWLKVPPGTDVIVRQRLQLLDDEAAVLSTSYYPVWMAAGTRLESPEALPEGPDELIEKLGHRFSHGIEVFRATMPTPEEANLLELRPGVPVVHMWDVDYDQQGQPLQVAHDIYAADRHEFTYEWNETDIQI